MKKTPVQLQMNFDDLPKPMPVWKGDYKLTMLDLQTGKQFITFIKNEYFLRRFKNKCRFSKKVRILAEEKMY